MYYIAYGSNLHPLRLILRVPSARLVGVVKLQGCRLTFHKRSNDGSSKCNLDFSNDPEHTTHVAVYDIPEADIPLLDRAEGLGQGYDKSQMTIEVDGSQLLAFVYLAGSTHLTANLEPYDWYKRLVLAGALKHKFPDTYIEQIAMVASKHDLDERRRIENENLLAQLEA